MPQMLVHVSINFRKGPTRTKEVTELFNSVEDWYRYAPNCWILWTDMPLEAIYALLSPAITVDDYVVITEMKIHAYFHLPNGGWRWLSKYVPEAKPFIRGEADPLPAKRDPQLPPP